MPTLDWIGKDKIVNHHLDVPYHVLDKKYTFGAEESENMIIHGDNLVALKALLPKYEGRIKCIYIDPPYNTGNERWIYNDNVSDPQIMKWLGEVVGCEGEDLSRHDKWLCMMYPRLQLLRRLLSDEGAIFIHIDENEEYRLALMMNEIFGERNNLGTIVWDKRNPKGTVVGVSYQHESILVYCKSIEKFAKVPFLKRKEHAEEMMRKAEALISKEKGVNEKVRKDYKDFLKQKKNDYSGGELAYSSISDDGRIYQIVSMAAPDKPETRSHRPLIHPLTGKPCPTPAKGWRFTDSTMDELLRKGRIEFGVDETTQPRQRYYLDENIEEAVSSMIYYGGSDTATGLDFDNPKPVVIAEKIIRYICAHDPNAIVLDSFAGSGTTGHAVLNINNEDSGNRKFILIELMDYADTLTATRIKRVINGYDENKNHFDGVDGDFSFYELGMPIILDDKINPSIQTETVKGFVYYLETKKEYKKDVNEESLLGVNGVCAYYFFYEPGKIITLNRRKLSSIKTKAESYVIYADQCTLSDEELKKYNITFKKPGDIGRI